MFYDRAERHPFWLRLWFFFSPFLFSPKKEGKENEQKNRDSKSCLSARSKPFKHIRSKNYFRRLIDVIIPFSINVIRPCFKTKREVLVKPYLIKQTISVSSWQYYFFGQMLPYKIPNFSQNISTHWFNKMLKDDKFAFLSLFHSLYYIIQHTLFLVSVGFKPFLTRV